jgi:spore germination protein GerM
VNRRVAAAAAVAVLVLATAGCGVRSDAAPRELSSEEIPYGLLEEAPATSTSVPTPSVAKAAVLVYFVSGDRMVSVVREVNAPASVPKALTALLFGPQEDEAARGIRSSINPTAAVQARQVDPSTYLVDLSSEFASGSTSEQVLGLAQIVYTATEVAGVTGVRFTLNGAPVEVPTPSGPLIASPVGREAFAEFAPVPPGIPDTAA